MLAMYVFHDFRLSWEYQQSVNLYRLNARQRLRLDVVSETQDSIELPRFAAQVSVLSTVCIRQFDNATLPLTSPVTQRTPLPIMRCQE